MTIELATCGHFAAFDLEGRVLRRICTCPHLARPRESRATAAPQGPTATKCDKCGGAWVGGSNPHSPHFRDVDGRRVLVDCSGEAVPR